MRYCNMMRLNPSQACIKLQAFIDRVKRIKADEYANKSVKGTDLNRLKNDLKKFDRWVSIATKHKNQDKANAIITEAKLTKETL